MSCLSLKGNNLATTAGDLLFGSLLCAYSMTKFPISSSSGAREGASLTLISYPFSNGITIKMSYGVDVSHQPSSHPIFSFWFG